MKEYVVSDTTGKTYSPSDVVRIINPKQAAVYLLNNVELLDFYASRDYKNNDPILVMIFDKEKSKEVYRKWCNFELR